jgi:hypothetical protein
MVTEPDKIRERWRKYIEKLYDKERKLYDKDKGEVEKITI